MTKHQREFFKLKTAEAIRDKPHLKELRKTLIKIGGEAVVLWSDHTDKEVVDRLLDNSEPVSHRPIELVRGKECNCHGNSLEIANRGAGDWFTGYALSNDGIWRPHSWVVSGIFIIETTELRKTYFGCDARVALKGLL